jgi:hypothetical protein
MDTINFSADKIETYYDQLVDSVYNLHVHSVNKILSETTPNSDKTPQGSVSVTARDDNADLDNVEGLDEHTKRLVRIMRTKGKLNNAARPTEDVVTVDELLQQLKVKIKNQVTAYREFWGNDTLNMVTILDEFGNERYKIDKKRDKINYTMITLINDVAYAGKYFDVMSWWRVNNKLYPELCVRASIVLGKPTHNGFQERVFSRGTYQDTKLKKRLKEENFEMSVLNAINNKKVQQLKGIMDLGLDNLLSEISEADKEIIQEQQVKEIQDFFDKGDNIDEEDGKPKTDDGKHDDDETKQGDENNDDNDNDSVYSSFSEILCMDGDEDDLSIAQMCQMLHLAEEENSYEFI